MSSLASVSCYENFTYQHLHGIMLVNLNKLATESKLSHAEYHLMGVLIGYWNKKQGKSYPTTRMLAEQSRMSNSTVNKCLQRLTSLGLIMIVKSSTRQTYYINTQKLLASDSNTVDTHEVASNATPCSHNHIETNRLNKIESNNNLIKYQKNPENTGQKHAYFNKSHIRTPETINKYKNTSHNEGLINIRKLLSINEPRLSKQEILIKLEHEGKKEEVETLYKLWKLKK